MKEHEGKGLEAPRIPLIESRLVTAFIHPSRRDARDYDTYNQCLATLFGLMVWLVTMGFAGLYLWFLDSAALAVGLASCGVVSLVLLVIIRWKGSARWYVHALCSLVLITASWLVWHTGGLASPVLVWLILVPGIAIAIRGRSRTTILWALIAIGVILGLLAMGPLESWELRQGLETQQDRSMIALSTGMLLVTMIILFTMRNEMERWLFNSLMEQEKRVRDMLQQRDRHTRRTLMELMDQSPEGVVMVSNDGEVVYCNPASAKLFGQARSDLMGMVFSELVDGFNWGKKSEGESYSEERTLEVDEEERPVKLTGFRATLDGEERLIVMLSDQSREYELRQQMAKMDRIITTGTLAAGVAHEVNNPLAFIASNVDFLLRRHNDESVDDETIEEALRDIQVGTGRVQKIVEELRQLARETSDEWAPVDVEEVVESAIRMVEHRIKHRATLERDFGEVGTVISDESGLVQIVVNLLVNALQAIPDEESSLDHWIKVTTSTDGEHVEVAVSDSGSGMGPEVVDRLFEPFFTTKEDGEGTGLGLPICQNLAHAMGGELRVESLSGEGTTVRLRWRRRQVEGEASIEGGGGCGKEALEERSLVLIDDKEPLLRAMARQLEGWGTVYTASESQEALSLIEQRRPDLILCDLKMPGVSGPELYLRLQREDEELARRLVYMSGATPSATTQKLIDDQGRQVVMKPVAIAHIESCLQRVQQATRSTDGEGL